MTESHLDEQLSALIDGELDAEQERQLRARIAAEPQLAERLARLEGVDVALRALPGATLPSGLEQSLRDRIDSADSASAQVRVLPLRDRRLWAGAGLAAAAALAVYLVLPGSVSMPGEKGSSELASSETSIFESALPESALPESALPESALSESALSESALSESALPETSISASALVEATDEEIGIVLDYETLADLEVIEDLELLEWMAEQDERGDARDGTERG